MAPTHLCAQSHYSWHGISTTHYIAPLNFVPGILLMCDDLSVRPCPSFVGDFQVQSSRGQGSPLEASVFTVDSKSMSLRSKAGRTIVREKYHTQLADFQLSEQLDSGKLIVTNKSAAAPVVVIHLKFENNLQRDTATLLLRSLAGADAVRRKDSSSGSIKGIGFLRRGLSASLTSI